MKPLSTGSANGLPFNKDYWDDMYAEDDESVIDGVFNAEGHAKYLYELFDKKYIILFLLYYFCL